MAITWRVAALSDIEPCLAIQPKLLGDALVGLDAAVAIWKQLVHHSSFLSAVIEANPPIHGHHFIGFGAAILISSAFADAEIANPQPDINSRIVASIHSGRSVLATQPEVAMANAGQGVDVAVLYGAWRDEILSADERARILTFYPASFAGAVAGHRVRRIVYETADAAAKELAENSVVYRTIADFPALGRSIHLMTLESVTTVRGSVGNIIFTYTDPVLRLRDSDQQLLLLALRGLTDDELATELCISVAAVKARWRSVLSRIAESMPALVHDDDKDSDEGRGKQKRHRVLAYVRSHPEKLRPYAWKQSLPPQQVSEIDHRLKPIPLPW